MIDEHALRRAFAALKRQVADLEVESGVYVREEALERKGGNPEVKFDPIGWKGETMKGRRYAECPPKFLDALARALREMSERPPKEPNKDFRGLNRRQAAIARTWARKLRRDAAAAARTPAPPATSPADDDDELLPL